MNALEKSFARSRGLGSMAYSNAMLVKQAGGVIDISPSMGMSQLTGGREQAANRERYNLFRGWLYSAINAIAMKAASQPVNLGRLIGAEPHEEERRSPATTKAWHRKRMTNNGLIKTAQHEFEIIADHVLLDRLENPNPIQSRWDFVYNFVANLCLTGRSYVICDEIEDGIFHYYSLPTSWVHPDHTDGPFTKFRIINPKNPEADQGKKPLGRENVAFASLPNPADPLSVLSPAQSQMRAIRIDDHIQTSQDAFFGNGIFPSMVATIGKDANGNRPKLSGPQRRQVEGVIRKHYSGVANYGALAIVDGWVEKFERFSAVQNEMGWEKSEMHVRTRILSAFGVHPFILGEPMNVGGYSQATVIKEVFCERVNTYLDMLSGVMTVFAAGRTEETDRLFIWWDKCEANDPALRVKMLQDARKNGDVSRNEFRAELGFPPDETGGDRNRQYTSGDVNAIRETQRQVSAGEITPEQAVATFEVTFDMSPEDAVRIAGTRVPKQEQEAIEVLQAAVRELGKPVKVEIGHEGIQRAMSLVMQDSFIEQEQ